MSYIFPQGYSGPFHDYYTYDDFDGAIPTSAAGGGVKALINGTNSNCFLDGYADLSGVFLKPRRFNNHTFTSAFATGLPRRRRIEQSGGTANYSEIISWNSGNKSMFLLTPEHVMSTAHGCQLNGTDRGFGRADDGNAILQFMERNGSTFNVTLTDGGLSGGASYLDSNGGQCPALSGVTSISDTVGADLIIFKLSEPIVGKDINYCNEFYDGWRSGQDSSADIFCLKSQNTVLPLPAGSVVGSSDAIADEFSLGIPSQQSFSCDSGSTTFVIHKEKGTVLTSRQADGVSIQESMIPKLNEYLSSEGYSPGVTLYKADEISQDWYNYFDMRGALSNSETITVPSWANAKKMSVRVVATDRNGRKSKPVTKIINVEQSGNIPPNISSEPLLSNLPISNSFYCSPGTDGAEIGDGFGSIYLGYTMDKHPDSEILYTSFGVTNNCSIEIRAGNTFGDNELSASINLGTRTREDAAAYLVVNFGGSVFTGFKGAAQGIVFGVEYAGLTIYGRPTTSNVLGITIGDWSELGKAITAGRGSTFTSFSFDNYGPTAGGTMIGTAAGYTAIPETGTNKIQNLFALGGLTVDDIKINGASYVSGMTFSGPTFALRIPSDCPAGASLGIVPSTGIQYINPYNLSVGVTFPGDGAGFTLINVGG